MQAVNDALIEETELRLLLEGVRNCYGFDFRDYAPEPLKRRIWERVHAEGAQTLSGYQEKVLHEPTCMEHLLSALRDNETGLFDDPGFCLAFRRMVVPLLRTYPSIQIWVPECASGNDVYSLAILLHEEGVLHRARIYATDLSETILCHTREAVVPLSRIANDTEQYLRAGGSRSFSEYYRTERDRAAFRRRTRQGWRRRGGRSGWHRISLSKGSTNRRSVRTTGITSTSCTSGRGRSTRR